MTEAQLYKSCDEILTPVLNARGFLREDVARYSKKVDGGEERVSVSKGTTNKVFSFWVSYYPDYMTPVDELFGLPKWDQGSLVPAYLTPVGATFRPKYWPCADGATLTRSLKHVIECLDKVGFKWLESLRDPSFYATQSDPVAALPYGFVNEVAGRFDKARSGYTNMLERLNKILFMFDQKKLKEREILSKYAKPFIFVAAKLGVEQERARYFREKLNYDPDIKPLPPAPR